VFVGQLVRPPEKITDERPSRPRPHAPPKRRRRDVPCRAATAIAFERNVIASKGTALVSRWQLLIMILIVAAAATPAKVAASSDDNQKLHKAVDYLRETAYSRDVRLCREAPRVAPNVYWVASDNLLAFKALKRYDSRLASTIRRKLVRIAELYDLPRSREDRLPLSLRYDVIIRDDETLEIPPRNITHLTLYSDSYTLKYDIANGTGRFYDWPYYADLRLLVALSDYNSGDEVNALSNLAAAANMWDGIGLRDNATDRSYGEGQDPRDGPHAYATYKLGLLLYVSGKLHKPLSFEQDVVKRIWLMQNQTSGGIFTHITSNGTRGYDDTNTETTAFVILGMTSIQNQQPNKIRELGSVALIAAVLAAVFAVSIVWIRRSGHKKLVTSSQHVNILFCFH
jgi:hypothetical protein